MGQTDVQTNRSFFLDFPRIYCGKFVAVVCLQLTRFVPLAVRWQNASAGNGHRRRVECARHLITFNVTYRMRRWRFNIFHSVLLAVRNPPFHDLTFLSSSIFPKRLRAPVYHPKPFTSSKHIDFLSRSKFTPGWIISSDVYQTVYLHLFFGASHSRSILSLNWIIHGLNVMCEHWNCHFVLVVLFITCFTVYYFVRIYPIEENNVSLARNPSSTPCVWAVCGMWVLCVTSPAYNCQASFKMY